MGRFVHLSLGIATALCIFCSAANAVEKKVYGTIVKIVDGDTVWVSPNNQDENGDTGAKMEHLKIRMLGMDTPETHLPAPGGTVGQEPWGSSAADHLTNLLPLGEKVIVKDNGHDKYGRTLAFVFVGNTDINLEMVRSGWAVPYIICEGANCNPDFFKNQRVADYFDACNEARDAGKGIWRPSNPLKELPFEFRLRVQKRKADKFVGDFATSQYRRPAEYRKIDICSRVFFMQEADAKNAGYTAIRE